MSDAASPSTGIALASVGVALASVMFGLVPFFGRVLGEEGLAPFAIAFYRFGFNAVILLPVLVMALGQWRAVLWGLGSGAMLGLGWIGYIAAVDEAPVSTVGVLYMTYPVFTVLVAWAMFGDPPTRRSIAAGVVIVIAAVIAGSPAAVPPEQIPILLLSLSAPIAFGFNISILVHRLSVLPPLVRVASMSVGSVLGLLPLMLTAPPEAVLPADPETWRLVAGMAAATALVPHIVYVICSPVIGASRSAVIGSIELPTMFAVGVVAFGERLSPAQIAAGTLVLLAILLTRSRATRNVATNIARQ